MSRQHFLFAAAAVIAPLPASAGVTVIGASSARVCYEAAEERSLPRAAEFAACDEALRSPATTPNEIVATHVNRGILHLRRGNIEQAMADFDRAMTLDPSEPETYLNRGSALMRREDSANAIAMFNEAIQRNTRRPELAYYGRGLANELSGNIRGAYQDYRRASQLAPRWDEPRIELRRFRVTRN